MQLLLVKVNTRDHAWRDHVLLERSCFHVPRELASHMKEPCGESATTEHEM